MVSFSFPFPTKQADKTFLFWKKAVTELEMHLSVIFCDQLYDVIKGASTAKKLLEEESASLKLGLVNVSGWMERRTLTPNSHFSETAEGWAKSFVIQVCEKAKAKQKEIVALFIPFCILATLHAIKLLILLQVAYTSCCPNSSPCILEAFVFAASCEAQLFNYCVIF